MELAEQQSKQRLDHWIERAEVLYNEWIDNPSFKSHLEYQTVMYKVQQLKEEHTNLFYPF